MVSQYNPDIDPTRLQPYGNPHARREGVNVNETEQVQDIRVEAAKAMSDEGESAEEGKSKGKSRAKRGSEVPEGAERLTNHPNEFVKGDRILDSAGHHIGTMATAVKEIPTLVIREAEDEDKPDKPAPTSRKASPPSGTPKEVEEAGTPSTSENVKSGSADAARDDDSKVESKPTASSDDGKPSTMGGFVIGDKDKT